MLLLMMYSVLSLYYLIIYDTLQDIGAVYLSETFMRGALARRLYKRGTVSTQ